MKKLFYLLFISSVLASCKKEYECTCDYGVVYTTGHPDIPVGEGYFYTQKVTAKSKKKAEEACDSFDSPYTTTSHDILDDDGNVILINGGNHTYYRSEWLNCFLD
tara:strand:+ start:6221 stop:6535 length:315 start_codon:yes stop_codon:yes gene_type:complete